MQDRFEATSEVARRLHPTSNFGDAHIELSVHPVQAPEAATLPERYGVTRFELLVVDPEWAYAIWEVPTPLPTGAVLQLRFYAVDTPGSALAGFNLHGDCGRWFVHAALPGQRVNAVLGLANGSDFHEVARRGPLDFPRNFTVESEHFEELQVEYERGPQGQLVLGALNPQTPEPWPDQLSPAAWPSQPLDWLDGSDYDHSGSGPDSSTRHARRRAGIGSSPGSSTHLGQGGQRDV